MNNDEPRGPWYLLTGLIIGALLGIAYTRYFQPVRYVDISPNTLQANFKDQYRSLIAAAYLSNGDLVRATARLELLGDKDSSRALTEQAQRTLAIDGGSNEARSLGILAIALGQAPPGPVQAITPGALSPTSSPVLATPADVEIPVENSESSVETPKGSIGTEDSNSPEAQTSPQSYVLISREEICDQALPEPLIELEVSDQAGQPAAGVIVIITWAGGEERFYTGLKSEKGLGYADYSLSPDFVYSLQIGESGAPLGNISAVSCTGSQGAVYWGALHLNYGQP
jgi:hypothetical protein